MTGCYLIARDLDDGLAGYARDGQRYLERYLASVAAFDLWLAAHPDQKEPA